MIRRSLSLTIALLTVTILGGLILRLAPLDLPSSVVKYGGSVLWAVMIYLFVSAPVNKEHLLQATIIAGALATAVEFFKLYHLPRLDAFRLTLPGRLLLGRFFSAWDVLAYWFATLAAATLDAEIRKKASYSLPPSKVPNVSRTSR